MIMPRLLLQGHMIIEFCKKKTPRQALELLEIKNDYSMVT